MLVGFPLVVVVVVVVVVVLVSFSVGCREGNRNYIYAVSNRNLNDITTVSFIPSFFFSSNGHTVADAQIRGVKLCGGNKKRKRQEMVSFSSLGPASRAASIQTFIFTEVRARASQRGKRFKFKIQSRGVSLTNSYPLMKDKARNV